MIYLTFARDFSADEQANVRRRQFMPRRWSKMSLRIRPAGSRSIVDDVCIVPVTYPKDSNFRLIFVQV